MISSSLLPQYFHIVVFRQLHSKYAALLAVNKSFNYKCRMLFLAYKV